MKESKINIIEPQNLLYKYIRGSRAYGLEKPDGTSDTDTGGVFLSPVKNLLDLGFNYKDQVSSDRHDDVYLELNKFMRLLLKSNPTVLESLFIPERCILFEDPIMTQIKEHRDKFITKQCFKPIMGYAIEQIRKCRGLHKHFLQEKVERRGVLDFVYTYYKQGSSKINNWLEYRAMKQKYCGLVNVPNMRDAYSLFYDWGNHFLNESITEEMVTNAALDKNEVDLFNLVKRYKAGEKQVEKDMKAAQFQNMVKFITEFYNIKDTEELRAWYRKQKPIGYRGLINGKETSNELRLSSVAKNELPICQISYNKDAYSQHCKTYLSQKEWEANRNPQRYLENTGKLFDRKNVAHSIRLMHMGLEIAKGEGFNVDRTNIDRDFILNIRLGNTSYEEIMEYLESKKIEMDEAMKASSLPAEIDVNFVNDLLLNIRMEQVKREL